MRELTCSSLRQSASFCPSAQWALQRQAQIRLPLLVEEDLDSLLPSYPPNSTVMDTPELEDDADARIPWCDVAQNSGSPVKSNQYRTAASVFTFSRHAQQVLSN